MLPCMAYHITKITDYTECNIPARILTLTPLSNHITPILKELHWLPVGKGMDYKIILLTFKTMQGAAPQYICELIKPKSTPRTRRSSEANLLAIPPSRTKQSVSRRLFLKCGASFQMIWEFLTIFILLNETWRHCFINLPTTVMFDEQLCIFIILNLYLFLFLI